jgi:CubicO group peptidase (beta-lactamase class C family)
MKHRFLTLHFPKTNLTQIKALQISLLFLLIVKLSDAQGVDQTLLKTIIEKGRQTHSSAIIIIQNNKVLVEEYYNREPKPEYIASAGKSLVAFAIAKLIDDGKIKSLDQRVYEFYPEWKQGTKKDITVRMLLNHTSGLQNFANASVELEPAPEYKAKNILQLALCAEVSDKPGTVFSYNNKAVALLGGIIEKASGKPFDKYFEEIFYGPMHIKKYGWIRDEAGNATTHGAFVIEPMDFAKFGLLLLNDGTYKNQKIISSNLIQQMIQPGQSTDLSCGLLWWRWLGVNKRVITSKNLKLMEDANVSPDLISKLRPILNDTLSLSDHNTLMAKQLGDNWYEQITNELAERNLPSNIYRERVQSKDAIAYYADGFRGNWMVVVPSSNLVAVRVRGNEEDYNPATDDFADFVELVSKMTK